MEIEYELIKLKKLNESVELTCSSLMTKVECNAGLPTYAIQKPSVPVIICTGRVSLATALIYIYIYVCQGIQAIMLLHLT